MKRKNDVQDTGEFNASKACKSEDQSNWQKKWRLIQGFQKYAVSHKKSVIVNYVIRALKLLPAAPNKTNLKKEHNKNLWKLIKFYQYQSEFLTIYTELVETCLARLAEFNNGSHLDELHQDGFALITWLVEHKAEASLKILFNAKINYPYLRKYNFNVFFFLLKLNYSRCLYYMLDNIKAICHYSIVCSYEDKEGLREAFIKNAFEQSGQSSAEEASMQIQVIEVLVKADRRFIEVLQQCLKDRLAMPERQLNEVSDNPIDDFAEAMQQLVEKFSRSSAAHSFWPGVNKLESIETPLQKKAKRVSFASEREITVIHKF